MLSPDEKEEIETELAHSPSAQGACIEAMKIVQRHRGWVSDEGLADIASVLGMSIDELDSVATFYNLIFRRPVGKHVIFLCDSVSCWVMEYEKIHAALKDRLGISFGETTSDGNFTLLPIPCLGACDRAPVMMIDSETFFDVTPEKVEEILTRFE